MDKIDKEIERIRKLSGGSWKTLSKVLYMSVPAEDRKLILEKVETYKFFQKKSRGRIEDYSYEQLFDWNKRVQEYSELNNCSYNKAGKALIKSKKIILHKSNYRTLENLAKELARKLEDFRIEEKKRLNRRKSKTSPVTDALLHNPVKKQ